MISSTPEIPYPDIYQYTENVTCEKPMLDIGSKVLEIIFLITFITALTSDTLSPSNVEPEIKE